MITRILSAKLSHLALAAMLLLIGAGQALADNVLRIAREQDSTRSTRSSPSWPRMSGY